MAEVVSPEPSPGLKEPAGEATGTLLTTEEIIHSNRTRKQDIKCHGRLISNEINYLQTIPNNYIRPHSERPRLNEVILSDSIPVVDLEDLNGPARHMVIRNIKDACQQLGFFQDQVSGLQLLKNGRWVAIEPIPNAFVVNIGDQLQVLSNGMYKSVIHRAIVNSSESRISIPTFYCPSPEAVIEPADSLINPDNPVRYRKFTYQEYYQKFWSESLDGTVR